MKLIKLLILVLCASQVLAISLTAPQLSELVIKSGDTYDLNYIIRNPASEPVPVLITINAPKELGINETYKKLIIPANQNFKYVIALSPPDTLPSGAYFLSVKVSEDTSAVEGMSAIAAVGSNIAVIKLFDRGMPSGGITLRNRYVKGEEIISNFAVRNYGKSEIKSLTAKIFLLENGVELKDFPELKPVSLNSLERTAMPVKISTEGLHKGKYTIKFLLIADGMEQVVYQDFNIESPVITINSSPVITAGKENEIGLVLDSDWNSEITNASMTLASERNLFSIEEKGINISPGTNILKLQRKVPSAKDAVIRAQLYINNGAYQSKTQFNITVIGSNPVGLFLFGEPKKATDADKTLIERLTPQGMLTLFILAIAIVGLAAFLFGRRSKGVQNGGEKAQ